MGFGYVAAADVERVLAAHKGALLCCDGSVWVPSCSVEDAESLSRSATLLANNGLLTVAHSRDSWLRTFIDTIDVACTVRPIVTAQAAGGALRPSDGPTATSRADDVRAPRTPEGGGRAREERAAPRSSNQNKTRGAGAPDGHQEACTSCHLTDD